MQNFNLWNYPWIALLAAAGPRIATVIAAAPVLVWWDAEEEEEIVLQFLEVARKYRIYFIVYRVLCLCVYNCPLIRHGHILEKDHPNSDLV